MTGKFNKRNEGLGKSEDFPKKNNKNNRHHNRKSLVSVRA